MTPVSLHSAQVSPTVACSLRATAHLLGAMLLVSCALPSGPGRVSAPPPPIAEPLTVQEIKGKVTVQRGSKLSLLQAGTEVGEGEPINVGAGSVVRLRLGQRALLELGPQARLVTYQLPRAGTPAQRTTALRLERGFLRVIWSERDAGSKAWPLEVSFARWLARVGEGEYFFDGAVDRASVCAFRGQMHLSGVPESTPEAVAESCASLRPAVQPKTIGLRNADWEALRNKRALGPTLRRAAATEAATRGLAARERGKTPRATATASAPARPSPAPVDVAMLPPTPRSLAVKPTEPLIPIPPPADPPAPPVQPAATVQPRPAVEPATATTRASEESPAVIDAPVDTRPREEVAMLAPPPASPVVAADAIAPPSQTAAPPPVLDLPPLDTGALEPDFEDLDPPAAGGLQLATELGANAQDMPQAATEPAPATPIETAMRPPSEALPSSPTQEFLPPPEEEAAGEWIVNVASHSTLQAAEQQAQELVALGLNAKLRFETVRGYDSYRVVIEGQPSEAAALAVVDNLDERLGLQSAWVFRKR